MGKLTLLEKIREWLSKLCWRCFLKLSGLTEDEYLTQIEEQFLKKQTNKGGQVDLLVRRCVDLEEELKVTDKLLTERQRVLDAIPECKLHGKNCVQNALEWIAKQLHEASA